GEVMGGNYCMPELSAALLLDQLPRLDAQHRHREKVARTLELGLAELGGFGPIPLPELATRRSIYEYGIQFRSGTFGQAPAGRAAWGGWGPTPLAERPPRRSICECGIQSGSGTLGQARAGGVAEALSAERGMNWWSPAPPLYDSTLMRPHTKRRFAAAWTEE